jgi:hypothetical protein
MLLMYTCISIHSTLAENVISKLQLKTDFLKIYISFFENINVGFGGLAKSFLGLYNPNLIQSVLLCPSHGL